MVKENGMGIEIRQYRSGDAIEAARIWNQVVDDGVAFPQENDLTDTEADGFFSSQSYCAVAEDTETGRVVGLYILHPNNVGRCGHICNASYAVSRDVRGRHIGEKLVLYCLAKAKEKGFRILQFNAVVASNTHALHPYERLGFVRLGTVPGGYRLNDGTYEDIVLFYHTL